MDDHFTNTADAVYLASLTQAKKILFLQKQLSNSQFYTQNLQKDLQAMKLTVNRLIKQRTNHQILAKISENMYRMQRRCRQMQQSLRQSNAKLLIQMQLRIQQKAQYTQKVRQLQGQIQLIRKTNKDKQQQFTIVVNKLRKYQDIRQLMLQQKINKDGKKYISLKDQDKEQIIKQLTQELNTYKKMNKQLKIDLDQKIEILTFALQNKVNYQHLKQDFLSIIKNQQRKHQIQRKAYQANIHEKNRISSPNKDKKIKIGDNLNESTKQLVKQIKKLVISNRLLQAALNQSIVKNQELVLNNQILIDANIQLKQNLNQYKHGFVRRKTSGNIKQVQSIFKQKVIQKKNVKKAQTFNLPARNSYGSDFIKTSMKQSRDDIGLNRHDHMDIQQIIKQKRLKQYLTSLKSNDYQVNIQQLYKDVTKMSQFLILSLGTRSKNTQNAQRITYDTLIQRTNNKKQIRSISVGTKHIEKTAQDTNQMKRNKVSIPNLKLNQGILSLNPVQVLSGRQQKINKYENQQLDIQQY